MSSVVEGARRDLGAQTSLDARVAALGEAIELIAVRGEDAELHSAADVFVRASERLRLSANHTVVALAGATGSGKSSTFNALSGLDISSVGVRRPTTSWATACVWGAEGAAPLLEWLGIPLRHQVVRDSMLDTRREASDLQGLVLLDLPDHDSTEVSHHLEVERLVQLADVLVIVLDPQKYADAAVHDRLLRPNTKYAGVMVAVLNHIDEVPEAERPRILADCRRLLDDDGLAGVPLLATAAASGAGVAELRAELARRVATKADTRARIAADVGHVADELADRAGWSRRGPVAARETASLRGALLAASGVDGDLAAIEEGVRRSARRASVWPPILAPVLPRTDRVIPDPTADPVVADCLRGSADEITDGIGEVWGPSVRDAAVGATDAVAEGLNRARVAALGKAARPGWAWLVALVQWLTFGAGIAGVAFGVAVSGHRPLAFAAAGGAAVIGLLIMLIGLLGARRSARRQAQARLHTLERAVDADLARHYVEPIDALLAERTRALAALDRVRQ